MKKMTLKTKFTFISTFVTLSFAGFSAVTSYLFAQTSKFLSLDEASFIVWFTFALGSLSVFLLTHLLVRSSFQKLENEIINLSEEAQNARFTGVQLNNFISKTFSPTTPLDLNEIDYLMTDLSTRSQLIHDIFFQSKIIFLKCSNEASKGQANTKELEGIARDVGTLATLSGKTAVEMKEILAGAKMKLAELMNDKNEKSKEQEEFLQNLILVSSNLNDQIQRVNSSATGLRSSLKAEKNVLTMAGREGNVHGFQHLDYKIKQG